MPPTGGKGKGKGRDARRSRSRNTTPSSIGGSGAFSSPNAANTAILDIALSNLMVPTNISYDDILERHGNNGGIPDSKNLEILSADLKMLAQLAETRGQACDRGMRELSKRRKERLEEEREKERADEERREKMRREASAYGEDEDGGKKANKLKRKKDQVKPREERPLTHGAHGVARQDGTDVEMKDASLSPEQRRTSKRSGTSPGKVKREVASASASSLSPPSRPQSPTADAREEKEEERESSPASSESSSDSHQPPPAPAVPQYQTFGPDPSTFDDPTIYHIRDVKPGMSEEEIKEIFSVAVYPKDDLHDLIPGTPPDRDFSNAKPANQVTANAFATYADPYLRPLTEEDMAFLKERGDRATPFVMPRRGRRHYSEIWAEEDGSMASDAAQSSRDKLPANQPRGSMDQMTDEIAESEQISAGPLLTRLLAAMRPESRSSSNDDKAANTGHGDVLNGLANGEAGGDFDMNGESEKPQPPAAFLPESTQANWKVSTSKLDYAQMDERLKQELRYIGFLGDDEPDYDAHYDDEVAARLRFLQAELKNQSIINGSRKARIQEIAKERMAHQEFQTILDDLDNQVGQAYLKRTRTLGKGKKNVKRPGGAGGGSHYVNSAAGVSKPGIGDVARQLMERRAKWINSIGPVFEEGLTRVPTTDESIFSEKDMKRMISLEKEKWDEAEE
ncbi:hypothetical protein L228DRAFT_247660 [Xylona heveae TC161]|uniref:Transcriptional regulator Ngg1 n=1 Tax=Xylona heveae (strain CBS 132557 / TC161) TaxID=1328760 RepID=A0A165GD63_XYLHT|nr:hypothetical protein L228DRAFT_247660 [Xylona heveae TC161]KZF22047.1 hypothetical protein L228DRAFT_247660 [Xylona heveae TC161]